MHASPEQPDDRTCDFIYSCAKAVAGIFSRLQEDGVLQTQAAFSTDRSEEAFPIGSDHRSTLQAKDTSRRSQSLNSVALAQKDAAGSSQSNAVFISTMAIPGQRFQLDLDADDFAFNAVEDDGQNVDSQRSMIKEIREHEPTDNVPPAPRVKQTKSGFPEHKFRHNVSAFKQKQSQFRKSADEAPPVATSQPSDAAIRHRIANKYGYDPRSKEKADISEENKQRMAAMSGDDIEEARADLMQFLSPALLERFLKRANIDDNHVDHASSTAQPSQSSTTEPQGIDQDIDKDLEEEVVIQPDDIEEPDEANPAASLPSTSVHFPLPPRNAADYKKLDPNSSSFLKDLRTQYFPELSHSPSSLDWLQSDPREPVSHSYAPDLDAVPASSLRFSFAGAFIPPRMAREIPVSEGLHHHGEAPESAGYTVPELALLARSTLPNQRCIAYQSIGRILYRLGKGEFGQPGSELNEAVWQVVENERALEIIMAEANREGGHASAKAYATEALWLWRKGNGGARGMKKPNERKAQ